MASIAFLLIKGLPQKDSYGKLFVGFFFVFLGGTAFEIGGINLVDKLENIIVFRKTVHIQIVHSYSHLIFFNPYFNVRLMGSSGWG